KDKGVGTKMSLCSCTFCLSDYFQFRNFFSSLISLVIYFPISVNLDFQPFGEGIYYRCPDTMQAAGYLIAFTAKFPPSMENRHNNFDSRNIHLGMFFHRDTPAVI